MTGVGVLSIETLHDPYVDASLSGTPEAELVPPTILPPPGLVVVVRLVSVQRIAASAGWLRLARRVVLVLDATTETAFLREEPELRERLHAELADAATLLGNVSDVLFAETSLEVTVREAAERLAHGDGQWTYWAPSPAAHEVSPGPWIRWAPIRWNDAHPPRLQDSLRHLAAGLCLRDRSPMLLDGVRGEQVDLMTGRRVVVPSLSDTVHLWHPIAAAPGGSRWMTSKILRDASGEFVRGAGGATEWQWQMDGERPTSPIAGHTGRPIGIDPSGRIAWEGGRCQFDWRVMTQEGPVYWVPNTHDWPVGHAKKLYGFEDNEPLWVHLAPDARACLSTYEHDVLLTPGLPLRWRDTGAFVQAERPCGGPRALIFQRSEDDDAYPGDPAIADEDARDSFATVTLGPSEHLRYVVGLDAPTWRMIGGQDKAERLEGPDAGWVVYNSSHRPVQHGTGRLLAGFDRWIVVLEDEELRREDLCTGDAEELGLAGRDITAALAVPGSRNVVLLSLDGSDGWLRVV